LALTCGRPVLSAPPSAPPLQAKHVMLAWKDTREARRAMSDALPFLKQAEAVLVAQVCESVDAPDATIAVDDVVTALKRHGVKAEGKVTCDHPASGAEIVRQAKLFGADLVVLGCYGHTRFGEWMFGGVTRDLLRQDEVYLLLSH